MDQAEAGPSSQQKGEDVESYHDIEDSKDLVPPPSKSLSILLKITQPDDRPLPVGVVTERSVYSLIQKATNVEPLGVTLMNDRDVVVDFRPKSRLWEITPQLHHLVTWDKYAVEVSCLMSERPHLLKMVRDREQARHAVQEYQKKKEELKRKVEIAEMRLQERRDQIDHEETENKIKIQDLLDKFEEQVKRIEISASRSSVPVPIDVDTPQASAAVVVSPEPGKIMFKTPPLPKFSGALPVPRSEGSYEQFLFQVWGFRNNYTEEVIKSSMIGSVTDGARDYLDFVGFDSSLDVLISALERRYGKGQTTDKIQQEFYQLSQERGETIQEFAGRIETKYKKLTELYPNRYHQGMLKERLFYGMTQHLRDSMRYLYKQDETTYDELLLTAKEAECEWLEHKSIKAKTTVIDDPASKEREEIRVRLDKLTKSIKSASFQRRGGNTNNKKKNSSTPSASPARTPTNSPRPSKGPGVSSAGPFKNGRRPIQCYKCGGWGHVARECANQENVEWREFLRADSPPKETGPESTSPSEQ